MAPSAAQPVSPQPISQRYSAGSCRLDVSFMPSALSQWTAKPIVDALTFQLWLNDATVSGAAVESENGVDEPWEENAGEDAEEGSAGAQKFLVAEGDRTQLQAIAQYFQAQTRSVLALSALRTSVTDSPIADRPSQPPPELQLNQPLGYLQLCDLIAVISQYEQATKTLPDALAQPASAASDVLTSDDVLASEVTASDIKTSENTNVGDATASDNVISLDAIRRAEPRNPNEFRDATARRTRRDGTRRNRRKTGMWASSAAAALFVVGLTTTLISRDPALQDVGVISDAPITDAQQESVRSDELALSEKASPDTAVDVPNGGSNSAVEGIDEGAGSNRAAENGASSSLSENLPGRSSRSGSAEQPVVGTVEPNRSESTPSPGNNESSPSDESQPENPPVVSDAPRESSDSAQISSAETEVSEEAEVSAGDDRAFLPPAGSDAPPANTSGGTSRGSADTDVSGASAAGSSERLEATRRSASNAPDADAPSASYELDVPDIAESPPAAPPPAPPPAPPSASPAPAASQPESLRLPSPATSMPEATSTPTPSVLQDTPLDTSLQVQAYFQQRWQSEGQRDNVQNIEGPLTYRLQLSETGTVDNFIALDERSAAYRDRLLPINDPPSFNTGSAASKRSFRVVFSADGGVEVSPL